MKVCVFGLRGFPRIQGGVEKHCEQLYPLLKDMELVIYRRQPYVRSDKTYSHIRFIDLPSTKIPGLETFIHSLLASVYICFTRTDIVHIHNIGPGGFIPLLHLFGKKIVLTYHSANYEHEKWGCVARWLLKTSEEMAMRYADRIIFVNRFQMKKYPLQILQKSVYIPNGVETAHPTVTTNLTDSIGLSKYKYILSVGRLVPEKGFDVLIQAFERLETDFRLVIVGEDPSGGRFRKELQKKVQTDRIIFTGALFDEYLSEIYTHASLFLLPSTHEGFPLVLLEAMSYGLDVLVSDIPATHLVTLEEEDYFSCGDADSLSAKLEAKLQNIRHRKYNLSEYDWQHIASQVRTIYKELQTHA